MKKRKKVKGGAQVVVQDAKAYQHSLDLAARGDVFEAIRQRLADVANGRVRPARVAFKGIRRKHRIPR